jgi:cytoskeletal protein CcmA (bactofilin family)
MLKEKKSKFFSRVGTSQEQPLTMIGEGISVVGTMTVGRGMVRLDGHLEGKITGPGTLVIGENGFLQGEIEVDTLILNGRVEGIVMAAASVHITPTGRLCGKVQAAHLIIDQGAVFDGEGRTVRKENLLPDAEDEKIGAVLRS